MNPRKKRERVTIQQPVKGSDGAGGSPLTWEDCGALVWASVIPLNGGEAFKQGMLNATQFYRVTISFRDWVTPRHRLMWKGTPLNIRTCGDLNNRRDDLVMTAESGAPEL